MSRRVEMELEEAFERHRRELHVYCYRMLASFDEAEDAVQETFLRGWRGRDGFDGENPRAWLYRIATNVCLDMLRVRSRRSSRVNSFADLAWLQPYPDRLLDELGDPPDTAAVDRETIELAFLTALQVLAPRQRAALVARDVLGWSATETAGFLGTSVPAANSALQRARARMRENLPGERADWSRRPTPEERRILERFIDAHERYDTDAALALAASDIRVTMPPDGMVFEGTGELSLLLERAFGDEGDWRLVPTGANRMPTAASYLRRPGDSHFRAFKLDVIRVKGERIAEVTTFGASMFPAFGLAATL